MRTKILQCAVATGIAGTLALTMTTLGLRQFRMEAEAIPQAIHQVSQYCAPEQKSDAADSPRVYCRDEIEVRDGVKPGDQVILKPPVDLVEGRNLLLDQFAAFDVIGERIALFGLSTRSVRATMAPTSGS